MIFYIIRQFNSSWNAVFHVSQEVPAKTWEDARDWQLVNRPIGSRVVRQIYSWREQLVCVRRPLIVFASYTPEELRAAIRGEFWSNEQ